MKKIIQVCSILTLAVIFSVVSVKAQTATTTFEAKIPHDFNLGTKTYRAGSYSLKVAKRLYGGAFVTLVDSQGSNLQTVLAYSTGSTVQGKAVLNFSRIGGERYLDGIITSEGGFQLSRSIVKRQPGVRITSEALVPETATVASN